MVARIVSGTVVAFVVAGGLALGASAQDDPDCGSLSAEEAQAELEANPTYATRYALDPDNDGVACEVDELESAEAGVEEAGDDGDGRGGNRDAGIGGGGRTSDGGEERGGRRSAEDDPGSGTGGNASVEVNDMPDVGVGVVVAGAPVVAGLLGSAAGLAGLAGVIARRGGTRA